MKPSAQDILRQMQKALAEKNRTKGWVKPKGKTKKRPPTKALEVLRKHLTDYLAFIQDKNYREQVEGEIGPALHEIDEAMRNRAKLQRKLFFSPSKRG
jgi:hypothetical protein